MWVGRRTAAERLPLHVVALAAHCDCVDAGVKVDGAEEESGRKVIEDAPREMFGAREKRERERRRKGKRKRGKIVYVCVCMCVCESREQKR